MSDISQETSGSSSPRAMNERNRRRDYVRAFRKRRARRPLVNLNDSDSSTGERDLSDERDLSEGESVISGTYDSVL